MLLLQFSAFVLILYIFVFVQITNLIIGEGNKHMASKGEPLRTETGVNSFLAVQVFTVVRSLRKHTSQSLGRHTVSEFVELWVRSNALLRVTMSDTARTSK